MDFDEIITQLPDYEGLIDTVPPEHPQIVSLTESMRKKRKHKHPFPKFPKIPKLPKLPIPNVPFQMNFKLPSKKLWFDFGKQADVFFTCKECGVEGRYLLKANVRPGKKPQFTLTTKQNLRFYAKVGVGANTNVTKEIVDEITKELIPPINLHGIRVPGFATFGGFLELNAALSVSGLNVGAEVEVVGHDLPPPLLAAAPTSIIWKLCGPDHR